MKPAGRAELAVRSARDADLDDIEHMLNDFVKGHPAELHARSRSKLREAYFGAGAPVGRLLVATRGERVIGMGQWALIYDMFWSAFGGNVEWLYVRPEHRRSGVVAAIVAQISSEVRDAGGGSCAEEAAGRWKRSMNGSRWAGKRTNATSRLKPSRPLLISRGWHLGTSFAASRILG